MPPFAHQVLILDDSDDIRDALAVLLESEGFSVALVPDVESAYRELHQGFRPCLVLLDIRMPGMDGWAFLDRMRFEPHLTDVPVVIVSGDAEQRSRAQRRGCEFLLKPFQPDALIATIERHCQREPPSPTAVPGKR